MTPKEKADELIYKFSERTRLMDPYHGWVEHVISYKAKGHALTAVDEIIANIPYGFYSGLRPDYKGTDLEYWQEIKQEIEKL